MPNDVFRIILLTTLSFVVAMLWTPLLTKFLYRRHLGKQIRDEGKTPIFSALHIGKQGTPTMGGLLIWVTVLVFALVFAALARWTDIEFFDRLNFLSRAETYLPLAALVAAAVIGMIDDLYSTKTNRKGTGLRMRHRVAISLGIALIGAWWFTFKLAWTTIHIPFVGNYDIGYWYIPIFVFVLVATSYSVNEADGLDGLAGGIMLAMFVAFAAIAYSQGSFHLAAFCAVVSGALLAFLWFNVHPARFFMGDTGAMGLGTTLGVIAMLTNSVFLLPIIGGLLVLESASVILQVFWKRRLKRKLFLSAPIHHHFEAKGWPESKVVMRFWLIAGVLAVVGLVLSLLERGKY